MAKKKHSYFQLLTNSISDSIGEILLYGYIGEEISWYTGNKEDDYTDIEFLKAIRKMEHEGKRIVYVRINSYGGDKKHGDAIVNGIKSSKLDVHTYCDGIAASMASHIFLAAKKENRHMPRNAKLMLHTPLSWLYGNAKEFREEADILDVLKKADVAQLAHDTGLSEQEVEAKWFNYEDNWVTAAQALEDGLIGHIEDYETEGLPANIDQMTVREVVQYFEKNEEDKNQGFLQQLRQRLFGPTTDQKIQSPNTSKMNIEEFTQSLDKKELTIEQITQALEQKGYGVSRITPAAPPAPLATPEVNQEASDVTDIAKAIKDALAPLQTTIQGLEQKVQQMGEAPGTPPTPAPIGEQNHPKLKDGPEVNQELKAFNEAAIAAAKEGDVIRIS